MTKFSIVVFFSILLFSACSDIKKPEFVKINKVKIKSISLDTIELTSISTFLNPNTVGGDLEKCSVDVYVNDIFVSKVVQNISSNLKGNGKFDIPIQINIPVKSLFNERKSLLDNVLSTIKSQSFVLKYKGDATVNIAGVSFDVPVESEEEVRIKIPF